MGKKLNAEELKEHIKKNGITLVRTTEKWKDIPSGTKLWLENGDSFPNDLFSLSGEEKNRNFNYAFDYAVIWNEDYIGLFELVQSDKSSLKEDSVADEIANGMSAIIHCPTKEDYIKIVDKIGWRKDKEGSANWETYGIDTTLTIKNNKITGYADLEFDKNHKPYKHYKFITAKEFLHPLRIYGGSHTLPKEYLNQVNDKGTLTSYSTDPFGVYMDKNGKIKRAKYNLNNNRKGNKFMSIQNVIKSVKAKLSPVDRKLVKNGFLTSSGKRTGEYNEELQEIAINKLIDAEDTKEFRAELAKSLDK